MARQLQSLAHEVDNSISAFAYHVECLKDIQVKLSHLREDMDTAVHRGLERIAFEEHHREIRVLSELMRYLMNDVQMSYEKAERVNQKLCEFVRGETV